MVTQNMKFVTSLVLQKIVRNKSDLTDKFGP